MLFVNQTELIILLVVCALAAACFVSTVALSVWVIITRRHRQAPVRELTGIFADASAAKQAFAPGEEFSCEGLVVNAVYNLEPSTEPLTGAQVLTEEEFANLTAAGAASGLYVIKPDMAKAGKASVVIRYRDRAAYYAVTVSEPLSEAEAAAEEEAPAQIEEAPAEVAPAQIEEAPAEVAALPEEPPAPLAAGGVRYDKSFTAKLIQSNDEVKSWYTRLKNELLSYANIKARMSWKRETFRCGRTTVARLSYRGDTLCVYLPLDPAEYQETKYKVEDASAHAAYADTPCMYRLKNERRVRYAAELIAVSMGAQAIERTERAAEEYSLPYEEIDGLIEKGLIKIENAAGAQDAAQDVAQDAAQDAAGDAAEDAAQDAAGDAFAPQPASERSAPSPEPLP